MLGRERQVHRNFFSKELWGNGNACFPASRFGIVQSKGSINAKLLQSQLPAREAELFEKNAHALLPYGGIEPRVDCGSDDHRALRLALAPHSGYTFIKNGA